jgi:aromatic-L-amino-acid/L-tryptophan decarboxylase
MSNRLEHRVTLDPENWEEFRALAHAMIDDTLDYLRDLRERPAWQPMQEGVRSSFDEPLPQKGIGAAAAYRVFKQQVRPYTNGNIHPRFWGWVQGTGTPLGMMAEMLGAAINPHMAGFNQAPASVEHQVVRWIVESMGFPKDASGLMVTGGSLANMIGLAVARHAKSGFDVRQQGVAGADRKLLVYGSVETHNWVNKGLEFMGMGRDAFRAVPVNTDYQIDLSVLREMLQRDKADGHRPICVIGTAGTVNTGAIDDLESLADIAQQHDTWFHVDGAFGAWARISTTLKPLVAGIERADSIGLDLHKWVYLPFDTACVLVRDAAMHRAAFASTASYLAISERGVIAGGLPFANLGIDLTRNFKALKVWMHFKAHGVQQIARVIEQNVEDIRYLVQRVNEAKELELLAPSPLNVVCFRYVRPGLAEDALNRLNQEVLFQLQEQGIAVPSATTFNEKFAIRVANVNHRSRREDFDILVEAVIELGDKL